ncbi:MAG TPA: hypothetical protein VFW00_03065 [Rhodocyclaceae bacterium]|nr:hypothetical protein [Rhodocyclaceae bacterium]
MTAAPLVTYPYAPSWEKNRNLWTPSATDNVTIVKDNNEFYADDLDSFVGHYLTHATTNAAPNAVANDCGDQVDESGDPDGAQESSDLYYCYMHMVNNDPGLPDSAQIWFTVNYQDYNNAWHSDTIVTTLNPAGSRTTHTICFNQALVNWVPGDGTLVPAGSTHALVVTNGQPC